MTSSARVGGFAATVHQKSARICWALGPASGSPSGSRIRADQILRNLCCPFWGLLAHILPLVAFALMLRWPGFGIALIAVIAVGPRPVARFVNQLKIQGVNRKV
jgi:hypothetical protein